ncbi:MAG TPA: GYD domain-containing protein [Terriglobia bacterium]|jgi:uncharacterized protein with GYD domain|nr:GYD domain-containing protein [Terriglobia bacterium]
MAKYLIQANYSAEGFKGVAKDKASGRKAALQKALASAGAKLDAIYYSFGDCDVVLIVDAPDNATVAAFGMAACSTGLARTITTPLLTIDEADQAIEKGIKYRGPGQ